MLTHCTMHDLIALRDGAGSAAARRHLAGCTPCATELERLNQRVAAMRALPAEKIAPSCCASSSSLRNAGIMIVSTSC